MASHNLSWVLGTHLHFGDLDFIVMMKGELAMAPTVVEHLHSASLDMIIEALEGLQLYALEAYVAENDQLLDFDYGRLERQLGAFLGPRPSWEDLCRLTFSFANVMTQLTRGEPLSLEYLIRSTLTTLSVGLQNAAETIGHLVAQRTPPSPTNDEFVGMTE